VLAVVDDTGDGTRQSDARCGLVVEQHTTHITPPPHHHHPPKRTRQATGLDTALTAASDPNYTRPQLPVEQFQLDLPWWFTGAQAGAAMPPPPPPPEPTAPPAVGVPAAGPYTVRAESAVGRAAAGSGRVCACCACCACVLCVRATRARAPRGRGPGCW
jgi:hypothetical protein